MPMNKLPRLREPRGPIVQQVRDVFLEREFKANPDDFYPEDIRLIENMDFLLQRCVIMQRKNVEASVKMVAAMLRWRKEHKVYQMKPARFPQEMSLSGGAFLYEPDKFGNRTLYMRSCTGRKCPELKAAVKDYLTYVVFSIDDAKDGSPFAVIIDFTNAGWSNYDIDLLMHFVSLLKDHFPVNLDYVLTVNFPWIMSAVWSLIKRLIPAERRELVQFINSEKIFDFVAKENVPDFLGGTCTRPHQFVNSEAPNSVDYIVKNSEPNTITKKRLREIVALISGILPEDHIKKLKLQVEQLEEVGKKGVILVAEPLSNGNDNNNNKVELQN